MADIFVSYTSSDRDWAFWIGQQLEKLGHTAHLHDWEVSGGGNIMAWMDERHDKADQVLCVVSGHYLQQPYSALERHGAQWAAVSKRSNFLLPVFVESCEAPSLFALLKRCDLHGLTEEQARERFVTYLKPAAKPSGPVPFPGANKVAIVLGTSLPVAPVTFPGRNLAISNIPITLPRHFLGRDEDLAAIDNALKRNAGRVAITALHGLRGVGKTTLVAAYAERHRGDYRVTWWIRAETESTMRADLAGLAVTLEWAAADVSEDFAIASALAKLRDEGDRVLLIYDNANNAGEIRPYVPRGGAACLIVTSTAPDWSGLATLVELDVWLKETGADYLTERTGRLKERVAALALSDALGGLPLAHEQAAAYCERIGISLAEYLKRFEANPAKLPGTEKDAPFDYGRTVATTFALAIDEAAKLHPAAEQLIIYAAMLAPEPIPLYLFSEAWEQFSEPLASCLSDDGLDEAIAALRAFALIDREPISDERNSSITTDCIRLHRLVRQVAAARQPETHIIATLSLILALASVYPRDVSRTPNTWPRARRLDALARALVADDQALPIGTEVPTSYLLDRLASFAKSSLADYALARQLLERASAIDEKIHGSDHSETATGLNHLGELLLLQNDIEGAQAYFERALTIREKIAGPDHIDTANSLNNLAGVLRLKRDFIRARDAYERALAITEKVLGTEHPISAICLNNLGNLLADQDDFSSAQLLFERALAIRVRVLEPDHLETAQSLGNLGSLLGAKGDFASAWPYIERALLIEEQVLGAEHPITTNLARNAVPILKSLGRTEEARALKEKYNLEEKGKE